MKRTVGSKAQQPYLVGGIFRELRRESPLLHALPDVFLGLRREVDKVWCVETVVAQFVFHYFVSREIRCRLGHLPAQRVGSQEQPRLLQPAFVETPFGIAVGTYGEDDAQGGAQAAQFCQQGQPSPHDLLGRKVFFVKVRGEFLMAIRYGHACLAQAEQTRGAEGDAQQVGLAQHAPRLCQCRVHAFAASVLGGRGEESRVPPAVP